MKFSEEIVEQMPDTRVMRLDMDQHQAELRRAFGINLHFRLGRRLFPWWATMTHGTGCLGCAGGGVWRARSREKLIAKCERVARRIAMDGGIDPEEITITIREFV